PETVNKNVPGEINNWQLNFGTNFVGITHFIDRETSTSIGLPFTATSLSAGYQLSNQIWLMAKFHLYMSMFDDDASAEFLIGPGIKAEFVRTDRISFYGGIFASIGNSGKTFLFSPELFIGIDYNVKNYLGLGILTDFGYLLYARDGNTQHCINFIIGPNLTIYF
ncbi:MAG TPA: hypothetical protein PLT70_08840, partial [bacterium]|nr:hypothetical protein [bacterium]